jgi:HD superfamily phosphohydrolase
VCHLAGVFVKRLAEEDNKENGGRLGITDKDILCVQIAGLCHDLGHGPLSHAFERYFVHVLRPDRTDWKHEKASLGIFEELIETNDNVRRAFYDEFKMTRQDKQFIKRLIWKANEKITECETGRSSDKDFLYEIVSNDENGIDVDKFDYFARDCYYLGITNSFDHNRLMKFAKVIEVQEDQGAWKRHICYQDKEVENIYDLFYQRALLHHKMCQHKTIRVIELMHMEALQKASPQLTVIGRDGKHRRIIDCIDDMTAYTNLTDGIFERILRPVDEHADDHQGLREARKLLQRVDGRDHYKFVGEATAKQRNDTEIWRPAIQFGDTMAAEELLAIEIARLSNGRRLKETDICVNVVKFDYGKHFDNPVENVFFYNKRDCRTGKKLLKQQVSEMLPSVFYQQHVRVYSREKQNVKDVEKAFRKWCETNQYTIIKDFGPLGERQ